MTRDTLIFDLIDRELDRQEDGLELIASENFVSKQVMEAAGSRLQPINMPKAYRASGTTAAARWLTR
jgi:hypothetical protein